ncbi:hypothetical protein [Solibacillus sp. NPDC093137]|uniref:hypothetical protein n=1 Tax=Solibacillus sp. NPDC093137 TaxID=3390678 RepID=UPI003D050D17
MRYLLNNKRGMTLVDIVISTVITFIIAIIVFSIIQSSLKQKTQQTQEMKDLFDITYALKVVTKDIRRSTSAQASISELKLTFPDISNDNSVIFLLEDNKLKKKAIRVVNGVEIKTQEIITDGLGCVMFTGNDVISITLSNTEDCSDGKSTEIHLRRGGI